MLSLKRVVAIDALFGCRAGRLRRTAPDSTRARPRPCRRANADWGGDQRPQRPVLPLLAGLLGGGVPRAHRGDQGVRCAGIPASFPYDPLHQPVHHGTVGVAGGGRGQRAGREHGDKAVRITSVTCVRLASPSPKPYA
jgi:hypothetical protein